MTSSNGTRSALVLSYSVIESDPRVRRQVDWLAGAGWEVDTLGLGGRPTPAVRDHFALEAPSRWVTTRAGVLAAQLVLPARVRFRRQVVDRIPRAAQERLRSGRYDLVVFNETEFGPLLADPSVFTPAARRARLHLDLHEYHNPAQRRQTLGARITGSHYRWVRGFIGHPAFTSRSVVNAPIGRLYVDEFGVDALVPVRNIPPFVDQEPSPVDPGEIRLLFHGLASWKRGFDAILDAMRVLPEHFSMTFMLMPNPAVEARLRESIAAHPAAARIRIVPPAPMRELAERINEYDLEIIFYRPLERNLEFALPNKFFEAVQGRLGVVVGESPAMAEIVRELGIGVVVPGFDAADLAASLADLTIADVVRLKAASHRAADVLNAEVEREAFLAAVESDAHAR
ncbi:glycosyltransferase [Cellulosimicrobium protaetiae]|uniref:Glycosyltransferase n=1 Tax=Cellulosimicrobium protaetiae TaxID=2587808 RepID=A0A6M5UDJ7_9MICO|nr:glycosyltransferase [Cellulosimicrobium protaetiae]QJW36094.1 glycosyltransferase [Cellulosimicrobium protaetiae]